MKLQDIKAMGIAAACALISHAAHAQAVSAPPSGSYACMAGSGSRFGSLEIKGASYRGVSLSPSGGFSPLRLGAGGVVTFTAGLGDFSAAGARLLSAKYMGTEGSSGHRPWISIVYASPSGNTDRLDCELQ